MIKLSGWMSKPSHQSWVGVRSKLILETKESKMGQGMGG